jgi:hypothetical protein
MLYTAITDDYPDVFSIQVEASRRAVLARAAVGNEFSVGRTLSRSSRVILLGSLPPDRSVSIDTGPGFRRGRRNGWGELERAGFAAVGQRRPRALRGPSVWSE